MADIEFFVPQMDGIVTTVSRQGFFANVGPLDVFVATHVCISSLPSC